MLKPVWCVISGLTLLQLWLRNSSVEATNITSFHVCHSIIMSGETRMLERRVSNNRADLNNDQQMNYFLAWFQSWSDLQKADFIPVLASKIGKTKKPKKSRQMITFIFCCGLTNFSNIFILLKSRQMTTFIQFCCDFTNFFKTFFLFSWKCRSWSQRIVYQWQQKEAFNPISMPTQTLQRLGIHLECTATGVPFAKTERFGREFLHQIRRIFGKRWK